MMGRDGSIVHISKGRLKIRIITIHRPVVKVLTFKPRDRAKLDL